MQAKDIMTSPVITVDPDMPVAEIATLLLERRISGVPVVDAGRRLVATVCRGLRPGAGAGAPPDGA